MGITTSPLGMNVTRIIQSLYYAPAGRHFLFFFEFKGVFVF
jgi:hypothetical protein